MGVEKVLNVALIGIGYWGKNLLRILQEIGVKVHTVDKTLRATYRDVRDLPLAVIDAAVVATPPDTHFKIADFLLDYQIPVLIEKPMTTDSKSARILINKAKRKKAILFAGHTFIYNPALRILKEQITKPEFGKILYIDSTRQNLGLFNPKSDVIWDLAPHDFSIILNIMDRMPKRVFCKAYKHLTSQADTAEIMLDFGGCQSFSHLSWLYPVKTRRLTIIGEKQMAVWDDVDNVNKIWIYDKGVALQPFSNFGEFQTAYRSGETRIIPVPNEEPLRLEVSHFLDYAVSGVQPLTPGEDGLKVVKLIEKCHGQ